MELTSVGVDSPAEVARSAGVAISDVESLGRGGGSGEVVVGIMARAMAAEFVAAALIILSTATRMTPSAVAPVGPGDSDRDSFGISEIMNCFHGMLVDCCFFFYKSR